jgi:hypothetical protein
VLVVEQKLSERPGKFGLAHSGPAEKDERTDRAVRIFEARARTENCISDCVHCFSLTDDPFVQVVFQGEQLLQLTLEELGDRDIGPAIDNFRDVLFIDLFFKKSRVRVLLIHRVLILAELFFELGEFAVAKFGGLIQIVLALGFLDGDFGLLDLFANLSNFLDGLFLSLPLGLELIGVRFEIGKLLLELCEPIFGRDIGLFFQSLALDLELHNSPLNFVELGRHRIDLGPQFGRRLRRGLLPCRAESGLACNAVTGRPPKPGLSP